MCRSFQGGLIADVKETAYSTANTFAEYIENIQKSSIEKDTIKVTMVLVVKITGNSELGNMLRMLYVLSFLANIFKSCLD